MRLVARAEAGVDRRRSWARARSRPSQKVLAKAGLTVDDLDVIELNEAFAAVAAACSTALGLPADKTNPNGGAIALGHPVGATGAILTVKIMYELRAHRRPLRPRLALHRRRPGHRHASSSASTRPRARRPEVRRRVVARLASVASEPSRVRRRWRDGWRAPAVLLAPAILRVLRATPASEPGASSDVRVDANIEMRDPAPFIRGRARVAVAGGHAARDCLAQPVRERMLHVKQSPMPAPGR